MSKKVIIYNFQNLTIDNAEVLSKSPNLKKEGAINVIFIRNPYEYFDYMLFDYLLHKRSLLFTQDIINNMKRLSSQEFLQWMAALKFLPFHNPQTFQLDARKRPVFAIKTLKNYDYVVPFEEIDVFMENVPLGLAIKKEEEKRLIFSLAAHKDDELTRRFIQKDLNLYRKSLELWEEIKKNEFKPLEYRDRQLRQQKHKKKQSRQQQNGSNQKMQDSQPAKNPKKSSVAKNRKQKQPHSA